MRALRRPVLVLVLAGLLGAVIVLGLQVRAADAVEDAEREALHAATAAVQSLLSYDHRTIDDDLARGRSHATGQLLREYEAATAELADQARAGQAVVAADVQAGSVVRGERDEVVVLLFVDQTTRRAGLDAPRVDQNRLRLTLERVDRGWLVSELETL